MNKTAHITDRCAHTLMFENSGDSETMRRHGARSTRAAVFGQPTRHGRAACRSDLGSKIEANSPSRRGSLRCQQRAVFVGLRGTMGSLFRRSSECRGRIKVTATQPQSSANSQFNTTTTTTPSISCLQPKSFRFRSLSCLVSS